LNEAAQITASVIEFIQSTARVTLALRPVYFYNTEFHTTDNELYEK